MEIETPEASIYRQLREKLKVPDSIPTREIKYAKKIRFIRNQNLNPKIFRFNNVGTIEKLRREYPEQDEKDSVQISDQSLESETIELESTQKLSWQFIEEICEQLQDPVVSKNKPRSNKQKEENLELVDEIFVKPSSASNPSDTRKEIFSSPETSNKLFDEFFKSLAEEDERSRQNELQINEKSIRMQATSLNESIISKIICQESVQEVQRQEPQETSHINQKENTLLQYEFKKQNPMVLFKKDARDTFKLPAIPDRTTNPTTLLRKSNENLEKLSDKFKLVQKRSFEDPLSSSHFNKRLNSSTTAAGSSKLLLKSTSSFKSRSLDQQPNSSTFFDQTKFN